MNITKPTAIGGVIMLGFVAAIATQSGYPIAVGVAAGFGIAVFTK